MVVREGGVGYRSSSVLWSGHPSDGLFSVLGPAFIFFHVVPLFNYYVVSLTTLLRELLVNLPTLPPYSPPFPSFLSVYNTC